MVLIFGIGNGLLTIHLLSSLKSDIVCMVISFFGMINVGEARSDDACFFNTPIEHSLLISFIRVALCTCATGYGLHDMSWPLPLIR